MHADLSSTASSTASTTSEWGRGNIHTTVDWACTGGIAGTSVVQRVRWCLCREGHLRGAPHPLHDCLHHVSAAHAACCVTHAPTRLPSFRCRDWNPASDAHLPKNYNITNFKAGKRACKLALQEDLGLPVNADIPLIAFIGRLDYQKGADIVLQVKETSLSVGCECMHGIPVSCVLG